MIQHRKLVALLVAVGLSQSACYTTYFISKDELRKLESSVEQKEKVVVYGDCPEPAAQNPGEATAGLPYTSLRDYLYAQNEEAAEVEVVDDTTTLLEDGRTISVVEEGDLTPPGCTSVEVSTANTVYVLKNDGEKLNVTPFNFIMSERQIVSPEYDMLESLADIEGAQVREFSTWKTVGLIVGVTAAAVGAFVGVSLLAPESSGF